MRHVRQGIGKVVAVALVAMALSGCMRDAPPEPEAAFPPSACGAPALQHLVGAQLPDGFAHDGPLRVFRTGDALTMDFNPRRLNIERHPKRGHVVRVFCG